MIIRWLLGTFIARDKRSLDAPPFLLQNLPHGQLLPHDCCMIGWCLLGALIARDKHSLDAPPFLLQNLPQGQLLPQKNGRRGGIPRKPMKFL
jgi:hypothetical protein